MTDGTDGRVGEGLPEPLGEGLAAEGFARAEDGVVWETYVGDDLVVQCPPRGDEALVSKAAFLYARLAERGARVPAVVDYREDPPTYLAVEAVGTVQLRAVRERDGAAELAALETAGEALAGVHSVGGSGYGEMEEGDYGQGSHDTWRGFAAAFVEDTAEYAAGGEFEAVARTIARSFEPETVPETPDPSVLHNDFRGDNVVIDDDGRAWVVDVDNAIYGDPRYEYVRAARALAGTDDEARAAFAEGYGAVRGPDLDGDLADQYALLTMAKSAHDGEWLRRNVDGIDAAAWAEGIGERYGERFG